MPTPPPGVAPRPQKPCPKCLNEKSHAKHDPLADNCIFYGVNVDITPAAARQLLLERDIALARDDVDTKAALSSPTGTSPPNPPLTRPLRSSRERSGGDIVMRPPPPPPPHDTKADGQHRRTDLTDNKQGKPPYDHLDDDETMSEKLLMDPLHELFGIEKTTVTSGNAPEPSSSSSSRPALLPKATESPTKRRVEKEHKEEPKEEPDWILPPPVKKPKSGITRGLDPIEAGAAPAIPAKSPPFSTPTSTRSAADVEHNTNASDRSATANHTTEAAMPGESLASHKSMPESHLTATYGNPDAANLTDEQGNTANDEEEAPPQDVWTLLQPLPPGWHWDQSFTQGLHPSTDVFDDPPDGVQSLSDVFKHYPEEYHTSQSAENDKACEKGESSLPQPEEDFNTEEIHADRGQSPNDEVPLPAGTPPQLTPQQRARLHALLRQRDADGKVPYDLDKYAGDAAAWTAYRKATKDSYRAFRKRSRAAGTWEKDDARGWGPPGTAPRPTSRDRSPLPRRRHPPDHER